MSTVNHQPVPGWAGEELSLLAVWGRRAESAEQVAQRTGRLVRGLQRVLGVRRWVTTGDSAFPDDPVAQLELVTAAVARDDYGDAFPDLGYSFTLLGRGGAAPVTVRISAGSGHAGRRAPSNRVLVLLGADVWSAAIADDVVEAVSTAFEPEAAALRDERVIESSGGRGGRAVPVGYRTWLGAGLGTVSSVEAGLHVTTLAGGSLLTAPDDWPAPRLVAAVLRTLEAAGISTIG